MGAGNFVIGEGRSFSNTTSEELIYFTDANSDGLPDLVVEEQVYFNTLDKDTGEVNFVKSSYLTDSPIDEGAVNFDFKLTLKSKKT